MRQLIKRIFKDNEPKPSSESTLVLQAENQRLHLALDEAQVKISHLESELHRQQRNASELQQAGIEARLLAVFDDLASPVAQFLLQLDLSQAPGHALQARDTLAVASALLRTLQNHGLEVLEVAGTIAPYEATCHATISTADALQPGQLVRVRQPGLAYRGQRLRKAMVIPVED